MQERVHRSQKYRQLADECRYLAEIAANHTWKTRYLQLAKTYDTLANQVEAQNSATGDVRISPED